MTELIIREFREEDLDAVVELVHHVVDISYHDVYPAAAMKMYKRFHSSENVLHDARNGYCVIAENDGTIVGTGTRTEDNIRRVYINPDCQKTGIGSKIYSALEQQAISSGLSRLGLGASLIAREFWESQGFVFENEESITTPNNEVLTFYIMSKELNRQV
ncbi:MAG: GNAT family N-acetyltransferase [Dehalococcoidales bacterium]|nr:GNAT family N-acetyltransferase [Dehalococcoidales bacterium]